MRPHLSPRHALIAALATAVLATGATAAVAAPAGPAGPARAHGTLRPLVELAAQRVLVADEVAAAKWATDSPIDDPAREREVLDAVARQAEELGADPAATTRIFRDQIEASKVVQRGLYHRWDADPSQAPTERPDLGRIRLEINRINGELVRAIADSAAVREGPSCVGRLTAGTVAVVHGRHLDVLHTVALGRSLPSVCER
ncbi:chorismate mutase [Streptomyces sp. SID8382]|uniref:chorismate mutase n=1 Tax=Streptomyces malaysiensis TaxID=92644 RepID=UPI000C2C3208|nr:MULTISPECIES: chorismate mutase [unclassified Streptomyces]AUA15657.1 Secreted chorismate mutase precursor [Streptomyces sp. M56]MYX56486.1 chorismate mutase [Streptomyces sp. SID8382]